MMLINSTIYAYTHTALDGALGLVPKSAQLESTMVKDV